MYTKYKILTSSNQNGINQQSQQTFLSISSVNFNLIYANLTSLIEQTFSPKSYASTSSTNTSAGYYFLNFSISNDNVTFSSPPLTLIAYDSRFYTCSSSTNSCNKIGVNIISKNKIETNLIIGEFFRPTQANSAKKQIQETF